MSRFYLHDDDGEYGLLQAETPQAVGNYRWTVQCVVLGEPKGQARIRVNFGRGTTYTPDLQERNLFRSVLRQELERNGVATFPYFPPSTPIKVDITFFFKRPASHYVGNSPGRGLQADAANFPSRPDIDNLGKFVLDAMTTIFYLDDDQVVELTMKKEYLVSTDAVSFTQIGLHGT